MQAWIPQFLQPEIAPNTIGIHCNRYPPRLVLAVVIFSAFSLADHQGPAN